jgi:hypothetical protein
MLYCKAVTQKQDNVGAVLRAARGAATNGCASVTSNPLCFFDKTIGNNFKLTAPIEVELVMLVVLSFGNAAL